MMCRIKNCVEAIQITKEMFDGTQEPPKRCYRFCSTLYGKEIPESAIISFDAVKGINIGDWVIEGLFETIVISDDKFNKFLERIE